MPKRKPKPFRPSGMSAFAYWRATRRKLPEAAHTCDFESPVFDNEWDVRTRLVTEDGHPVTVLTHWRTNDYYSAHIQYTNGAIRIVSDDDVLYWMNNLTYRKL